MAILSHIPRFPPARGPACFLPKARSSKTSPLVLPVSCRAGALARGKAVFSSQFSTTSSFRKRETETFDEFTARYEKEFDQVNDVFDLQRNLNNAFAYDLVPAPSVIVAALRAARRVNDFATAVRVFEALREKVEHAGQYKEYLEELKPLRQDLGIETKEELYPNPKDFYPDPK